MRRLLVVAAAAAAALSRPAGAEPPARSRDASLATVLGGPFHSSRLFTMPLADVVGAYQLSVAGDGSLLDETGLLSFAGAVAIGFGDLAQLEYRHTGAIGIGQVTAPVPAVGVQVELPLPRRPWWPGAAVAFRLGVPRREALGDAELDESVTDLYLVGRLRLEGALAPVTLHGGVRVSSARVEVVGDPPRAVRRTLALPAGGVELALAASGGVVCEAGLLVRFVFAPEAAPAPRIGQAVLGRAGVRWRIHPVLSIDGSVAFRLGAEGDPGGLVPWDIRLGGELFVPWGALGCRAAGIFCD
jgi:hypothetical protein